MKKIHEMKKSWLVVGVLAGSLAMAGCSPEEDDNGKTETGYVAAKDVSVQEGSAKHVYEYIVTLSRAQNRPVTVAYETRDGTAEAGKDYESQSGVLLFAPGALRSTIDIPILGDEVREPDEYFELHLSSVKNAEIKANEDKAAITIANDDDRPTVSFEIPQQSVSESVGTIKVTAMLSQGSGYPVEAELETRGTAKEDDDYIISGPLNLTFAPGETEASLDVSIQQDTILEGGETIKFTFKDIKEAGEPGKTDLSTHNIIILGDNVLNDTGMVKFSDGESASLSLEPASHPGQDASSGRDTESSVEFDGHKGFSFTKLDQDGNPLPSGSQSWTCARDNTTGLVWENKVADVSLSGAIDPETGDHIPPTLSESEFRGGNFVYGWHNDDPLTNGGDKGLRASREGKLPKESPVAGTGECGYAYDSTRSHAPYCHTKAYIQEMNHQNVCGFIDWRMPTNEELRSLANYEPSKEVGSSPDSEHFQNVKTNGSLESVRYFSSTPAADNEGSAWCYDFGEGEAKLCKKDSYRAVMAVRNKQ